MAAAVKRKMHLERQMDVHGAGEKRQNTQRETDDEAEQIKIGPGHATPQDAASVCRCASWNSKRGRFTRGGF